MKKILIALLTVTLMFAFTGCGNAKQDVSDENQNSPTRPERTESLEEIIELIYAEHSPEFSVMTVPVDLTDEFSYTTYTGLSDISNVEEAAASEPMIGSQAYSLTLVRVKDGTDTEALAKEMAEGIDPRKWICVEADDLSVAASGNLVMLIMISSEYSDQTTSEQMIDAFETVCGGLDVKLINP